MAKKIQNWWKLWDNSFKKFIKTQAIMKKTPTLHIIVKLFQTSDKEKKNLKSSQE